jgi:sugar/nucleoside kinase (ribokinase family)
LASPDTPDLIVVGQVTIDDVVPASPGPWKRQMGGSSLYAVAGARLWLDPGQIGLVARVGSDYPFDPGHLLERAGLKHVALHPFAGEHLIEWLIYEPDGSRRSLPRNSDLLDIAAEGTLSSAGYHKKLLSIAPCAAEVPRSWLPAAALHLCPQVGRRQRDTLAALRGQVRWISVDPSPHTSRDSTIVELAAELLGATAFLPSANEIRRLLDTGDPAAVVLGLHRAGFAEVALKRGDQPMLLASGGEVRSVPVVAAKVVDPTGAGDAFCGAYAACRVIGYEPIEAVRRAAATAALVVGCSGVEQALSLKTPVL